MTPSGFDELGRKTSAPQRISVTVSPGLYDRLAGIAIKQGRSISNLCAYLLDRACDAHPYIKRLRP